MWPRMLAQLPWRSRLPQLKFMNSTEKKKSFKAGFPVHCAEFNSFGKFQFRNYLLFDQWKKIIMIKKNHNPQTILVEVFSSLLCFWNLYFWITLLLCMLPSLPRHKLYRGVRTFLNLTLRKGKDPVPLTVLWLQSDHICSVMF